MQAIFGIHSLKAPINNDYGQKLLIISKRVFFVCGRIPKPIDRSAYVYFKASKKTSFLAKCLNKKCYFINFSLALKLWS